MNIIFLLIEPDNNFLSENDRSAARFEIFKAVLSGLIVGGGGLILYAIKSSSDRFHANEIRKNEFLKSILDQYNSVKSIRRRLRHRILLNDLKEKGVENNSFYLLILELNEVQLELETLKRIAKSRPSFLTPYAVNITKCLSEMENFVNAVVKGSIRILTDHLETERSRNIHKEKDIYSYINNNTPSDQCDLHVASYYFYSFLYRDNKKSEEFLFSKMDEIVLFLSHE